MALTFGQVAEVLQELGYVEYDTGLAKSFTNEDMNSALRATFARGKWNVQVGNSHAGWTKAEANTLVEAANILLKQMLTERQEYADRLKSSALIVQDSVDRTRRLIEKMPDEGTSLTELGRQYEKGIR